MMRRTMPKTGQSQEEVLAALREFKKNDTDWKRGRSPLYVFDAGDDTYEMGSAAFVEYFKENALGGRRAFPSVKHMEDEVVDMALDLLRGGPDARGFMTTGGTESIIQAVQSCRDWSRERRNRPELRGNIVAAWSAHPAFNKAARLMDLEVRRTPCRADLGADPEALAQAVDEDTIMVVGSAPCFPYGVIDPISEIGAFAAENDIWMHVDACVGGYIAPFVRMIGRHIPDFDFSVQGVRSISADLHKFGFCPKPASTVFYSDEDAARFHAFDFRDWPNGQFLTNTICGTRPAGAVAAAWSIFQYLGVEGYKATARELMAFVDEYRRAIEAIPGLKIMGNPHLSIVAFGSDEVDIFRVAEVMHEAGWLPGLVQQPRAIHRMMSLVHAPVLDEYIAELTAAVDRVRDTGHEAAKISATY